MNLRTLEETIPLGQPTLRQWKINENTTHYERVQAAPSDHDLALMWSLYVGMSIIVTTLVGLVMYSILLDRKARSNPFNQFLIYLMIPDLVLSGSCGFTCLLSAVAGHYWSETMCRLQGFYIPFGIGANNWLNLAVGWEILSLLRASSGFQKYRVPSTERVFFTALAVYAYSCFMASWALWADHFDNFPHRIVSYSGVGCAPLGYSRHSTIFYFLVYFPLLSLIPFFAVLGMGFYIWYYNLMPPTGRRRTLAIFFGRIIAVFTIFRLPSFALGFSGAGSHWLLFAGGSFGHCQGAVSAAISLTKPDIRDAISRLIRCRFRKNDVGQSFSTEFVSFQPSSVGAIELFGRKSDCPEVLSSPRHVEPSQNDLDRSDDANIGVRSDDANIEVVRTCERNTEECNELACWPD